MSENAPGVLAMHARRIGEICMMRKREMHSVAGACRAALIDERCACPAVQDQDSTTTA